MRVLYVIETGRKSEGAAYNRVLMLCDGLIASEIKASVALVRLSPVRWILGLKLWMLCQFMILAFKIMALGSKDAVIIYGESLWLKYILKLPRRAKLIVERNEYSTYIIRNNIPVHLLEKIKEFEHLLSKCDGMIVCSTYLAKYYSQFTKVPVAIIPLVVDIDKFKIAQEDPQKYIAYCGDFGSNKDGLPTLLSAFSEVCSRLIDYKLYLIGDTNEDNTMEILSAEVDRLQLTDRVVFTGRIPHDDMPQLLGEASLLVLSRPANKQAEGGIPSKLAEYLASGRPTLITRVGEIDKYLTDKVDVFFATPDSISDFAEKICFIINNYRESQAVGLRGAETVRQFDYKIWGSKLKNFILHDIQR